MNIPRAIVSEWFLDEKVKIAQIRPYSDATGDNTEHFRYGAWNLAYDEWHNIIYAEDTRRNTQGPFVERS